MAEKETSTPAATGNGHDPDPAVAERVKQTAERRQAREAERAARAAELRKEMDGEVKKLRRLAIVVIVGTALVALGAIAGVVLLLPETATLAAGLRLTGLSVLAGVAGSAVSALQSASQRVANGWELSGGTKLPHAKPKDKFGARMIPLFAMRPVMGALMGLLVYVGLVGGFLIATTDANQTFSPQGIVFLSALGGLFAKTFVERLKVVFKNLLGVEQPASNGGDGAVQPKAEDLVPGGEPL